MSAEHWRACMRYCPKCKCITCQKDNGKDGNCCTRHSKVTNGSCYFKKCYIVECPDYEKEEP